MPLTTEQWIETYRRAWIEADADLVTTLFAADGEYRWNLLEPPASGREEIRRYWERETGKQADVEVEFGTPFTIAPSRIVVEFWTRMLFEGSPVTLPGCMFLSFDEEGRCRALREYWIQGDGDDPPPDVWGR
jgi:hypothetical protein